MDTLFLSFQREELVTKVINVLKNHFDEKLLSVNEDDVKDSLKKADIVICRKTSHSNNPADPSNSIFQSKENQIQKLENNLAKSLDTIKTLENQLQKNQKNFRLLLDQYEQLKVVNTNLLWSYLPSKTTSFQSIPAIENNIIENNKQIKNYTIQELLGEGHYAAVYSIIPSNESEINNKFNYNKPLAVKIIDKDKIMDLRGLERINSEISTLQDPNIHDNNNNNNGLLYLYEVIHTSRYIYLITERGGKDLFDFFDQHQDGVGEDIAKKLLQGLIPPLYKLHCNNYCHRDLKPENILISDDEKELKLIDFGLCTKIHKIVDDKTVSNEVHNNDFCGSPGFFAPEILLSNSYNGQKADIWSIGCILLELVLGHEYFMENWMSSYDYNILQNKKKFQKRITQSVLDIEKLLINNNKYNHLSIAFKSLLLGLLCLHPDERTTIHELINNNYLNNNNNNISVVNGPNKLNHVITPLNLSINTSHTNIETNYDDLNIKKKNLSPKKSITNTILPSSSHNIKSESNNNVYTIVSNSNNNNNNNNNNIKSTSLSPTKINGFHLTTNKINHHNNDILLSPSSPNKIIQNDLIEDTKSIHEDHFINGKVTKLPSI